MSNVVFTCNACGNFGINFGPVDSPKCTKCQSQNVAVDCDEIYSTEQLFEDFDEDEGSDSEPDIL